jgi:ADP-ribose pyrophosphatase YjhB (NUDIX family)
MDGVIRISVCFLCHDGKGNFVLHKRSQKCRDEQGRWDAGGGGLKFGEKIEDALVREIKEEYCATPKEIRFLGYRDVFREQDGVKTHWIAFDHQVLLDPGEVKIGEPEKCDELRWVTLDEIKHFTEELHSQFPAFFDKYGDILI